MPDKIWKIVFNKNEKKKKGNLIGIGHHRKMTSKEDKPYKKKTLQEDMKKALQEEDITGIYPYRKMTSQKDNLTKRQEEGLTGR